MADGDLKYPATGLDSFYSVDLANIWNAIENLNGNITNASNEKGVYMIAGTLPAANQISFDLSTAFSNYNAGDRLKITVLGLSFVTVTPSPILATQEAVTVALNGTEVGVLLSNFFETPANNINQLKAINLSSTTCRQTQYGQSSAALIGFTDCIVIPEYLVILPSPNPTIDLNVGSGITFLLANTFITIQIEKVLTP